MVHDTYDSRWQKSRIVKKPMVFVWFLHGSEIQKNRYAEIVKKPLVFVWFLDRHAEKYIICIEKTRDNKTTRSGINPENEGQQKGPIWSYSFCRGQTLENDKNMCLAEVIREGRAPGGSTIIFL